MDPIATVQIQPKVRRIKLEIIENGKVVLTAPPKTPQFIINRFIADHQEWINKHTNKLKGKVRLFSNDYIYLFGRKYKLIYNSTTATTPGFKISHDSILYTPIAERTSQINQRLLTIFLKSTCEAYVFPRTAQIAKTMQVLYKTIGFKEQKTRWGSCSSRGTLSFNWRLVHFAPKAIDYVITHELAHLAHPNHSRAFWKLVAQYYPNFASAKKTFQQYYW